MASTTPVADPYDFSVVLGGPLHEMYRRTHLCGMTLGLASRRAAIFAVLAWLPLLLLSMAEGAMSGQIQQPFLLDIDVHARLLIALPLLIVAEVPMHLRMRATVRSFIDRALIPPEGVADFRKAIVSSLQRRGSSAAELSLLVLVYVVGITFTWRGVSAEHIDTWYRQSHGEFTLAGWWYFLVSLPLFQFLLLRWYYRLILWTSFLFGVSRAKLNLIATHPDRCAGLGFVGHSMYGLVPLLFAHGVVFAAVAASGAFNEGRDLATYWPVLFAATAVVLLVALVPMMVFIPVLYRTRNRCLREYGVLGQRAVDELDQKRAHPASLREVFSGDVDVRAVADLTSVYRTVSGMRIFVVSQRTLLGLAAATALPLLPLALVFYPPGEVIRLLWRVLS